MKYKHPTLGREARESRNTTGARYLVEEDGKRLMSCDNIDALTKLGFEPVDEIPEWVGDVIRKYNGLNDVMPTYISNFTLLKDLILQHMPKQKKITVDEVNKVTRVDEYGEIQYIHYSKLIDLLRDKGLLQ